jgi:ankyrin repeat protein
VAAQFGHLDALRCLVKEFGADVNSTYTAGSTPLFMASANGNLLVVMCLGKELGADVSRANDEGGTPLYIAAQNGYESLVQYLVKELGEYVDQAQKDGSTPLFIAVSKGHLPVVKCLVNELGADIHRKKPDGGTLLMEGSLNKDTSIVKWSIKAGVDPQASANGGTAADVLKEVGASTDQIAYLVAKMYCSKPGCSGAGITKCTGCKRVRYCGELCQLSHWKAHKADCKRWSAERISN